MVESGMQFARQRRAAGCIAGKELFGLNNTQNYAMLVLAK